MGTFPRGLILAVCLTFGGSAFAQDAHPVDPTAPPADPNNPGLPVVTPAEPDPNAVAQPAPVEAATNAAPAAKAPSKPKKKTPPALPTLRGAIAKLDPVTMTITVDAKGKEETVAVTSKTRIMADGKFGIFGDLKQGEKAIVEYQNSKSKGKEALTIRIGGAAQAEPKAAPKSAKKPKKHPKPGAPKHDEPAAAAPVDPTAVPAIVPPGDPAAPVTPAPTPQ